jgi:hypothetical protein
MVKVLIRWEVIHVLRVWVGQYFEHNALLAMAQMRRVSSRLMLLI